MRRAPGSGDSGPKRDAAAGQGVITEGILIVFGVLAGAIALFAWGRPRSDAVAILVVLALNLCGGLTIHFRDRRMFIPVVMAIANRIGLNPKRMLMPLSVAALVSGMMTLWSPHHRT